MLAPIHPKLLDREAYLALEQASGERHEYVEGHVYAMVGGTQAHNIVCGNLYAAIHAARGGCRVFQQGMKLRVQTAGDEIFFYPDVMAVCDPADDAPGWVERPVFIAEVLSPSTGHNDWGIKLVTYRTIPSLREYAVVDAAAAQVTVYRRANDWRPEEIDMTVGTALTTFDARLDVETLYAGVAL
ncbi:MAG: Uma2 family endonuclease [Pseudomonadota bacterium]